MRRIGMLEVGLFLFAALLLFVGVEWLLFPGHMTAIIPVGKYAPTSEYPIEVSGTFARICGAAALLIGLAIAAATIFHMRDKQ